MYLAGSYLPALLAAAQLGVKTPLPIHEGASRHYNNNGLVVSDNGYHSMVALPADPLLLAEVEGSLRVKSSSTSFPSATVLERCRSFLAGPFYAPVTPTGNHLPSNEPS